MQLLIPSAKLVSEELQSIGKLPAIIYPVNKKIVFDYLLEQYNSMVDSINIICYEKCEKVHRRLSNYESQKIHICDLPDLNDLGHTVNFGLSDNETQVIINFADTIVMENANEIPLDSFYYSEDYHSETWTYFVIKNGVIERIYDKVSDSLSNNEKGNLFVGVFSFSDSNLLKSCLEQSFADRDTTMSSFYQAIMLYSKIKPLQAIHTSKWFDIGHQDRYYNSTLEVKAREFNHITIDKDRGILKKTSDDIDKFIGEIKWYLKLPGDIEYVRPRIFDYSTSYDNPYVSMEYYAYHTVHELFLYGDLTKKQWMEIFSRIAYVYRDFQRFTVEDNNINDALEDMYLNKTLQRFEEIRNDGRFNSVFYKDIVVNDKHYVSIDRIINKLKMAVPELLYNIKKFSIIHGDLCFANIMVDSNFSFIKVIDPRGKFGKFDIYGDPRYELAKLFHSVDGKYDFIIKDLFRVSYDMDSCVINYVISDRSRDYDLYQLFVEVFSTEIGEDLKKIELIEALLFLSMIPLHRESFDHQVVMLGTGLDILNRVVDITA